MEFFNGIVSIRGVSFFMFSIFSITFIGFLFGRIKIKGINLGSAGVFIISLLYGAFFSAHLDITLSITYENKILGISIDALRIIENLGLIFFVGSVGFICGPNFFKNLKQNFKSYIILGLLIVLSSAIACVICFFIGLPFESDKKKFVAMLVGILSGAMTSTPAFSAVKSTVEKQYEITVTVGHGIAYLFGVIGVVLFVQIIPKILGADMEKEKKLISLKPNVKSRDSPLIEMNVVKSEEEKKNEQLIEIEHNANEDIIGNSKEKNNRIEKNKSTNGFEEDISDSNDYGSHHINKNINKKLFIFDKFGFCVFSFAALTGIFLGEIKIPISIRGLSGHTFSLTTTGGVLLISLLFGNIGKIGSVSISIEKSVLEVFRELGLILFLIGAGIAGGAKFIEYFKISYFLYGMLMTTLPMVVGFIFSKFVLKLCLLNTLGSITGGMTSTPALGTLINVAQTDDVASSYAATYPFSLISIVFVSQFLAILLS